jgi:hypothetical protein
MKVEPATIPAVSGAIKHAARLTGTNFQYLLATAQVESRFNPDAGAATSSARGLFQFIEQTWLATLKEQGPALGYGRYAEAIGRAGNGQYVVTEPRLTQQIMKLRSDPTANAVMAGAYTRANTGKLAAWLGRKPSERELYLAHFFGAHGAAKLIGLADARPGTRAAEVFPSAARANPTIFYAQGRARSAAEVYRLLVGRYDVARNGAPSSADAPTAPMLASAASAPVPYGKPRVLDEPAPAAQRTFVADPAELAETYAAAARLSRGPAEIADAAPVFHGLFRTSERREAVAPVVSALWSVPASVPTHSVTQPEVVTGAPAAKPAPLNGSPLDLFKERAPDARALFRGRV